MSGVQPLDVRGVAPTGVPLALATAHREHAVGDELMLKLPPALDVALAADVVHSAGFTTLSTPGSTRRVRRERTLPSYLAPGLRLLLCGLNPSLYAADAGVGFARPGNRFWPAALAAGLATRDRDPLDLLTNHHVGMTDLVKRATVAASELRPDEYADGFARLERLVAWLEPRAVCVLGLDGWRRVVDRKASPGWQPRAVGGRPAYLMPNPSGLNAHATPAALAAHLRAALTPP